MVLTFVWAAMVVYAGTRFFNTFHVGLTSCLPADFPGYPRASLASIVVSDSIGDCIVQYRTRDSAAEVQAFFETNLDRGDWSVTSVDEGAGLVRFQRVSKPDFGQVKVIAFPGQETQFQIELQPRSG